MVKSGTGGTWMTEAAVVEPDPGSTVRVKCRSSADTRGTPVGLHADSAAHDIRKGYGGG